MAKIRWTNEAVNWLNEIYNYISQENPNAAHKVVNGIYNKAQVLREFPKVGH
ncbi:MAG: type II toxin-antitoxin system RelE/ParE family toxin [Calditrichaeota bacterium]|nr:MAG: type II toxin-antitoxin system RelE/ParE family toxin [Calditrichota bacterium]MBL1204560.1 type II toxin-antitoxin system RelE/ParE family toxin [Calditrichota bacterium]NOG44388.1 type II toxin-antitoxin system RelE/ParE family toxin [Calditrichota bacterium]